MPGERMGNDFCYVIPEQRRQQRRKEGSYKILRDIKITSEMSDATALWAQNGVGGCSIQEDVCSWK
jgi:hypothetical protein